MENPVLGEWLILFMLILNCSRIFFLKYGKIDCLTILSPLSVIFAVFQIFAWGADFYSVILLLICIFAFFTNFRAFLRFISGLYVDHYSIAFKIGAVFVLIFTFAEAVMLVYFRPVLFKAINFGAKQERIRLSGDFTNGFRKSFPFEKSEAEICVISPDKSKIKKNHVFVIMPDKSANLLDYKPLAYKLAESGYPVYLGEFFARDVKWCHNIFDAKYFRKAALILEKLYKTKEFNNQKEFFTFNMLKECDAMINFVQENEKRQQNDGKAEPYLVIIGDWMSEIAVPEIAAKKSDVVLKTEILTSYKEYTTPGYGFIRVTNPTIASKYGLQRDAKFEEVSLLAKKIIKKMPVEELSEELENSESVLENNIAEEMVK